MPKSVLRSSQNVKIEMLIHITTNIRFLRNDACWTWMDSPIAAAYGNHRKVSIAAVLPVYDELDFVAARNTGKHNAIQPVREFIPQLTQNQTSGTSVTSNNKKPSVRARKNIPQSLATMLPFFLRSEWKYRFPSCSLTTSHPWFRNTNCPSPVGVPAAAY